MTSDHSTPNEAIVSEFVSRLSEKKKGIAGSIQRQQPILATILAENEKFQVGIALGYLSRPSSLQSGCQTKD